MKSDFEMCIEAIVAPKICSDQPAVKIDIDRLPCVNAFDLADSNFDKPGGIDILVGVDVFCKIFMAIDEGTEYPRAAEVLKRDIYVDDVVTGAESVESALDLQSQVIKILEKGCFELRKWSSNCPRLLESLDPAHCHNKTLSFDSEPTSPVKVLGMEWNPSTDAFTFTVNPLHEKCTKRNILSELARIFDPLGFLTPLTLSFKRIIQDLWTLGLDWDVVAPPNINQSWLRYRTDLELLSSLEIPRFILSTKPCSVQLHGFCDASEAGYSAVIYFRIEHGDGSITTHLIMSRCKVSPLKRTSIPRLELCAAVLLTDLVVHVKEIYDRDIKFEDVFCWTKYRLVIGAMSRQKPILPIVPLAE
ncbi:uncharacterized protein LOC125225987 [Leguminivora glycinivorella]|uniref:uncharacterized protein LOC125225987 n=1 Tax=Leguminivora glycinivorella TaxID=1035111 RepID=UPI00200D8421|nr:uncharacterized protein LOC125225987 [Leguminivora glycinivorella]